MGFGTVLQSIDLGSFIQGVDVGGGASAPPSSPASPVAFTPMPVYGSTAANNPADYWMFDGEGDDNAAPMPGLAIDNGEVITITNPWGEPDEPANSNYTEWLAAIEAAGAVRTPMYRDAEGSLWTAPGDGRTPLTDSELEQLGGQSWSVPSGTDLSSVPQLYGEWSDGNVFETYLMMMLPALAGMAGAGASAGSAGGTAAETAMTVGQGGASLSAPPAATLGGGSTLANAAAPTLTSTAPTLTAAATAPGLAAPTAATFGTGSLGFSSILANNFTPENLAKSAAKNAGMQLVTTGEVDPEKLATGVVTGGVAGAAGGAVAESIGDLGLGSTATNAIGSGAAGVTGAALTGGNPGVSGFASLLGSFLGGSVGGTVGQTLAPIAAGLISAELQDPVQGAVTTSSQPDYTPYRNKGIDAAWTWKSPLVVR